MAAITKRRICWPDPDATCLEGGCTYCDENPFRSLREIRLYAETAGVFPNRALGERTALAAYEWGLENNFPYAETR
jgi:hypothetical protein